MQVNFWLVRAESKGFVQAEVIFVWKRIIAGGGWGGGRRIIKMLHHSGLCQMSYDKENCV